MAGDLWNVDAPQTRYTALWVQGTSAWQGRQYLERLFEFGREDVDMGPILKPPFPLSMDVAAPLR